MQDDKIQIKQATMERICGRICIREGILIEQLEQARLEHQLLRKKLEEIQEGKR